MAKRGSENISRMEEGGIAIVQPRLDEQRSSNQINARFKYKKKAKRLRLEQSDESEEDNTFVVLCALQTLLAPVRQVKMGLEGQVPCEGYFVVVDVTNPTIPVYEHGFIFFPPNGTFRKTKEAVANLINRCSRVHGIDVLSDVRRTKQRLQESAIAANDFSITICTSIDEMAAVVDKVVTAVSKLKSTQDSTTLFLTEANGHTAAELSLQWMRAQSKMKMSKVAVKELHRTFPDMERVDGLLTTLSHSSESRCCGHPLTYLNEFGKPFYCCKEAVVHLHKRLVALSDWYDQLAADDDAAKPHNESSSVDEAEPNFVLRDIPLPSFCDESSSSDDDREEPAHAGHMIDEQPRVDGITSKHEIPDLDVDEAEPDDYVLRNNCLLEAQNTC